MSQIKSEIKNGILIITIDGRFEEHSQKSEIVTLLVNYLNKQKEGGEEPIVIVVLENCSYINSVGLSSLITISKYLNDSGFFWVANVSKNVKIMLEITQLDRRIKIGSLEEGLEKIKALKMGAQ